MGEPVISTRDRQVMTSMPLRRIHSLPLRRSIARVSGLASKATMTRLVAAEVLLGEQRQPAAATAMPVRVKELGGNIVWLRPRSRDRAALEFSASGHHLPPAGLTGPVRHAAVLRSQHRPAAGRPGQPVPAGPPARRRSRPRQRVAGAAQPGPPPPADASWRRQPSGTATGRSPSPGSPTPGGRR